jgi:ABC-type amino acid transport substrate-binding protein
MKSSHLKFMYRCLLVVLALGMLTSAWPALASQGSLLSVFQRAWIQAHGVLKVGAFNDYPPFGFVDKEGRAQGISIDFWRLLAKKLDITVSFFPVQFAGQLKGLKKSRFDSLAGIFRMASREKDFDFTEPYCVINTYIWVGPKHKNVKDWAGLKGLRLGAVSGDSGEVLAKKQGLNVKGFGGYQQTVLALAKGSLDAIVMDDSVVAYFLWKDNLQHAALRVGQPVDKGEMTLPVAKGNAMLLGILNKGVAAISDQEWQAMVTKWGGR